MSFLSKPFWKILCDILEKAGLRVRRLNLAYSRLSMTWDKSFNLFNHQLRHQRNENNNNKMVLFAYLTRFLRSKDASELKIKVTKSKLFSVNYTSISLTLRKKKKEIACYSVKHCIFVLCFLSQWKQQSTMWSLQCGQRLCHITLSHHSHFWDMGDIYTLGGAATKGGWVGLKICYIFLVILGLI